MNVPKAVVCLPTYNERENLERMIDALEPHGVGVLVIDDNSPDGTGAIAEELAATRDWLSVLHRTAKEGLGRAYIAGFREVLATDVQYILQMDCDFSHDPADVPRLIAAVENGADLAIGSRYVKGGGTSNWGVTRQIMSRGASVFTQLILMPVRDATGGFKCFRREVLEAIDLDSIDAAGYVFQVETTFRARRKGFKVVEIPIHFADRTAGQSKMSFGVAAEGVWKVPRLRLAAWLGRI
jgi:dolichol-phosphate mannosyltransferase